MRTTNKAFKTLVQEHIIERLSDDQFTELHFQLNEVVESFYNWYCKNEQKRTPNKYTAFQEWLMGLPSCINIEFMNYEIMMTLKGWFETVGDVYKERDSEKEVALYLHLVTREFEVLCKKHNIKF